MTKILAKVKELSMLRFDQLQELRDNMTPAVFAPGDYVIQQGERGDTFFVVMRGTAVVKQRRGGEAAAEEELGTINEQMCFGEKALLSNEPRSASIVVVEEVEVMKIDRVTFERVLGPLQQLLDAQARKQEMMACNL